MKRGIVLIISIVGLMFSCDLKTKEAKEAAQRTVDSLRTELQANKKMTESLLEIGTLIDSIDANRKMLRVHMMEGTNYETYVSRMKDINEYVQKTERKIAYETRN